MLDLARLISLGVMLLKKALKRNQSHSSFLTKERCHNKQNHNLAC